MRFSCSRLAVVGMVLLRPCQAGVAMRYFSRCYGVVADLRGRGGFVGERCNRKHCVDLLYKTSSCRAGAVEAPDKQGWPALLF